MLAIAILIFSLHPLRETFDLEKDAVNVVSNPVLKIGNGDKESASTKNREIATDGALSSDEQAHHCNDKNEDAEGPDGDADVSRDFATLVDVGSLEGC